MKNEKLLKRDKMDKKFTWNLEDIFSSDGEWEISYNKAKGLIEKANKLKGTLGESSDKLRIALETIHTMELSVEKLFVYARMRKDEDNGNTVYQALADRAMQLLVNAESATAFFTPEILAIDDVTIDEFFVSDSSLATYSQIIKQIRDAKDHTLSEGEEKILAMAGEIAQAPDSIYRMLCDADMKFPDVVVGDESYELTHGKFIPMMEDKNQEIRKGAFKALYSTYKNWDNTVSATLASSVKSDIFFAKARKYNSSLEASLKVDNVPKEVYTSLIEAVHNALPDMHKYIDIKRQALGLDEMHMYDLYVPIVDELEMEIDYEVSKELLCKALAPLGDEYVKEMKAGLDSGSWVDVYQNEGKSSGAYSWGVWGKHPYVLMNWNNNIDNTFTLAHEFGHAMHTFYSDSNQEYHNSQYRLILAEVASTCNEAILMDYMLKNAEKDEEKRFLINYFLEQFRTTVFRQVMFAEFEMIIHDLAEKGEALTPEYLRKIYHDLNVLYYGPNMVIDEEIDMEWARIPHFYRAFYVYKYATGFSSAIALSKMILEGSDAEREKYLTFLKSGGSKYPLDLLKDAGVDLTTPQAVGNALKRFSELVNMMGNI